MLSFSFFTFVEIYVLLRILTRYAQGYGDTLQIDKH